MSSDYRLELLPYVQKVASRHARRLIILRGLPADEKEDLQQDLFLAYWQRSGCYEARHGTQKSFVRMVLEHEASNLIAKRIAACRDFRRCTSLGYTRELAGKSRREDRFAMRIDFARALAEMKPDLRRTAQALSRYAPTEVACRLGISRATLYRRMDKIRVVLAKAGLVQNLNREKVRHFSIGSGIYSLTAFFQAGASRGAPDVKGEHVGVLH